jgi:hypothetical protein
MKSKRGQQAVEAGGDTVTSTASVIEPDLRVIVSPESRIATVIQLPVNPTHDRMTSLLERLERLERGLEAVGERLDRVAPPNVRLVEAHDDPSHLAPWTERHSAAAALPRAAVLPLPGGRAPHRIVPDISVPREPLELVEPEEAAVAGADGPDYLPDEVFLKLQRTVVDRLRQAK